MTLPSWMVLTMGLFTLTGCLFMAVSLIAILRNFFDVLKYRRLLKRQSLAFKKRMGKEPIAKCYCGECAYRDDRDVCHNHKITNGLVVHESWFCCWGELKKWTDFA